MVRDVNVSDHDHRKMEESAGRMEWWTTDGRMEIKHKTSVNDYKAQTFTNINTKNNLHNLKVNSW